MHDKITDGDRCNRKGTPEALLTWINAPWRCGAPNE